MNFNFSKNATSVLFQFIMIGITSIVVFYVLYNSVIQFHSFDKRPQLDPITPQVLEDIGSSPTTVKVGLDIINFSDFDVQKNKFSFTGVIWFEFDPSLVSIETIGKFSFNRGDITSKSDPKTLITGGNLLARYDISVDFSSPLNFAYFPLNDHTLYIVIDNSYVSPGEIVFDTSIANLVINSKSQGGGNWLQADKHAYTGYITSKIRTETGTKIIASPRVIFAIDYARTGLRQLLTIFLPLVFIFYVSVFSLLLDPKKYQNAILSMTAAGLTGTIAYRFVIENLSPPGIGYFMLTDWIFFFFLGLTFVAFLVNTLILNASIFTKRVIIFCLHSAIIIGALYLANL